MTTELYPLAVRLARCVPGWDADIAYTLAAARTDPIHGPALMRETLERLQRDLQGFLREVEEEDRCPHCGAPPGQQLARWAEAAIGVTPGPQRCPACGALHRLSRIVAVPLARAEDPDVDF